MAIGVNGSGDYAKRVASPNFTMTGNTDKCTIAGWMKVRDITPGAYAYNLGFENADVSGGNGVLHGYRNTDVCELYSTAEHHTWATPPSQDTWYYFYITGANDGSGYIIWKGGYYTATGSSPVETHTNTAGQNELDVVRICVANDSYDEPLNSCLSMVRVWTGVELSDPELRAERDSYFAKKTSGLWADWRLENNTDTADDSGNNRTLTFGGTLTSESDPELGTVIGLDTA